MVTYPPRECGKETTMISESVKLAIKRETAGMSHNQREGFALDLATEAAGEPVGFLKCDRAGLTGWIDSSAGAVFSDTERDMILRAGLDPEVIRKKLSSDRAKKSPATARTILTDEEAEGLRRLGLDPALVARMDEVRSLSDYRRIRFEVGGLR